MNELMQENKQVYIANESAALLSMIERVCLDPKADIEKLERMLAMQEKVMDRNAKQAFASDFAAMQSELPRIAKNGLIEIKKDGRLIQSTPFAKLEDINDGVRPTLQKYGFGASFSIKQTNNQVEVTAKLMHRLGYFEETSITLPLDSTGSKNAVQSIVSSTSYGKRVTLCAILNISTGDDTDGHKINESGAADPQSLTVSAQELKQLRDALKVASLAEDVFCRKARINKLEDLALERFTTGLELIKQQVNKNVNN